MQGKIQIFAIFVFALLLRWCVTYHSHSGQDKPPMFGDYEAQRHWQEITLNLPIEKWYINTKDNDLQYWGLDYPPLTAYHSLLLGHIANFTDPSFVKLHSSRGISSEPHKYFMRLSVLIADSFIYVPAMYYFVSQLKALKDIQVIKHNIFGFTRSDIMLITGLIYPGIILIDHGHFQYNCVSLGCFIFAVTALLKNSFLTASFFFVLALNYKQMELYHALPFFFYILGSQLTNKNKSWISAICSLIVVSFTVILTFAIIWAPFAKDWNVFMSVVRRLFPFARGVFEDKVANIWCAINVIFKLRNFFTNVQLAKICLVITTIAVLPTCINLYLAPTKAKFIISLINSALAFFLFSFQVHEKSILLAAVPVVLYFHVDPLPCFWFLLTSHFSMLPLFIKDDLCLAYFATIIFYFVTISWIWGNEIFSENTPSNDKVDSLLYKFKLKKKVGQEKSEHSKLSKLSQMCDNPRLKITLFYLSIFGMSILSIVSVFIKPPKRYPDLFPLLVSVYSCAHFCIFYLYFNYKQFSLKNTGKKSKVH